MAQWGESRMTKKQKRRKRSRQVSSAVVFILVFVLFVVVFGALLMWFFIEHGNGGDASGSESSESTQLYTKEDVRSVLILLAEDRELWGAVLLRADPAGQKIDAVGFPEDTLVSYERADIRLNELYRRADAGTGDVLAAMKDLCGLDIDHYAVFSKASVAKVLDGFQHGLIYNIKETVAIETNGRTNHYYAGIATFTSSQVLELMQYKGWNGGAVQRTTVQAEIVAAVVNQNLKLAEDKDDAIFKTIVGNARSDITFRHYNDAKKALTWLAIQNSGSDICAAMIAPGGYAGTGAQLRYEPVEDFSAKLAAALKIGS